MAYLPAPENFPLPPVWRCVRQELPPYSQMCFGAQIFRDQRIGCFLDTVVEEPVGIFQAEDETRSDRFPKLAVHVLLRILVNHRQQGELCAIADTGQLT